MLYKDAEDPEVFHPERNLSCLNNTAHMLLPKADQARD